ncbi:hypothetical protein H4R18_001695 [Coemansia javaensis]|uniref:Sec20 C-terminal domain-containing protein n=1 Tax=Coemansia javaensis TaxID=2761396 RepID=A0A9W8HEW3_9FUNG|nr:hypothetical protein H4R18_001695 [Coemansia javaensis]
MAVGGEFDLPEAQLAQLGAELDGAEAGVERLGGFSGGREEHRALAEAIREQQRSAERLLETLRAAADDCDSAAAQAALRAEIEQREARARQVQRGFRLALLQYRGNAAAAARQEREELLSGATTAAELRRRKARGDGAALRAAADVTAALQETVSMMNQEIEKSAGNIIAMQASSDALRKTRAQYLTMDDMLNLSKRLVRSLEQADAMDRWLMLAGILVFSLVALNILRKRLWIPGLHTLLVLLRSAASRGPAPSASAAVSLHIATDQLVATTTSILATTTSTLATAAAALTAEKLLSTTTAPAANAQSPSAQTLDTLGTPDSCCR